MIKFFTLAIVVALSSCSHDEKKPEAAPSAAPVVVSTNIAPDAGASMETKQVAAETNSPFATEIVFKTKSATLSKESTARLNKILKQALSKGSIGEINAYVWGDQEYPGGIARKLPPKQQNLARARGENLKQFFAGLGYENKVKIITMTEQPSGLKGSLSLGDTRDKKTFEQAGINTTDKNKKAAPKASRAAIMIQLEATKP